MRSLIVGVCVASAGLLACVLLAPKAAFGFGGEDVIKGNPWHHEDITKRGLTKNDRYEGAGFSPAAASAIAWHADYIDSYLYNPLFWTEGIVGDKSLARLDAALAGYADLAKLHFDDTFDTGGLRANWQRYSAGTLAGLYWASLQGANGDLGAGQNILGVSFHAVQDFYSHSNWVDDPARRCKTWFQLPAAQRSQVSLYTGAYERPRSNAPQHHGAYSLSCSLVRGDTLDKALDPICTGRSPFQNTSLCEEWRLCRGGKAVTISVKGKQNDQLVFLEPSGIALDTTWLARVQAVNRKLVSGEGKFVRGKDGMYFRREACSKIVNATGRDVCKLDADQVFAGTKDLAIRATKEWADYLGEAMKAMGPKQAAFWGRLKQEGSDAATQARQYEDFSRLPYQFLSAGPYPGSGANGWYLRLRVRTTMAPFAETDSNIYARVKVNGRAQDHLLDYLPTDDKTGRTDNRLLVFDDFEGGRDTAYMVGPFAERPQSVSLYNDSSSSLETVAALFKDFANAAKSAADGARQSLISIVAGNADYVADATLYLTFAQLDAKLPDNAFNPAIEETARADGRDQGVHDIVYRLRRVPAYLTADEKRAGWIALEVQLYKLNTIRESKLDRTSGSDEPFVIFHTASPSTPPSTAHSYVSEPLKDMDDGDVHVFGRRTGTGAVMKVAPGGGLVLSTQVFESDSETAGDRTELMQTYVTGFDSKTRAPAEKFGDELGRLLGADWGAESIEVFAFKRGAVPEAGVVLSRQLVGDVRADQASRAFELKWDQVRPLLAAGKGIDDWQAEPVDAKVLDGVWHARGYDCAGPLEYDAVDVAVSGDKLEAKKSNATKCAGLGEASWRGTFGDGVVTGEFYKAPPPESATASVEMPPNYLDKSIDPFLDLEGNWRITWQNAKMASPYVVLSKGPTFDHVAQAGGGYWHEFRRDPKAPWQVSLTFPPHGSAGSFTPGPAGVFDIKYPYGVLGHWGGTSKVSAGNGAIAGEWTYGDQKGRELWTRVRPRVTDVESLTAPTAGRKPVGQPVTLTTAYSETYASGVELRLYGSEMWGLHRYWLAKASRIDIADFFYICVYDGKKGYATHRTFGVCQEQGGVLGVVLNLAVMPKARPGQYTLQFNDQKVPFNLEVTGAPRFGWRRMKLEMASCSMLREVDAPEGERPLQFLRSDFRGP
jgi:hypothetical protein